MVFTAPPVLGHCPFRDFQLRRRKLKRGPDSDPLWNHWTSKNRKSFRGTWRTQCQKAQWLFRVTQGVPVKQVYEKALTIHAASLCYEFYLTAALSLSIMAHF